MAQIREYFKAFEGILIKNISSKIKAYTPNSSHYKVTYQCENTISFAFTL